MTEENNVSNWFQDNLRIIISVGIVILLVFAIYSYSNRNSRTDVVVDDSQIEEVAMTAGEDSSEINEIIDEIKDEEEAPATEESVEEVVTEVESAETVEAQEHAEQKAHEAAQKVAEEQRLALEKKVEEERLAREQAEQEEREAAQKAVEDKKEEERRTAKDVVREVIESRSQQRTGVVATVAVSGDSMTTLARKAAAEYAKRNNVTDLTASHKVYIEDYLRKLQSPRRINPGTEMEFTEAQINEAIERSRALTDAQLKNLEKYAQNISSLQ